MINNNLSDYLVTSKYSKVLATALYQQNYVIFLSSKREGFRPPKPQVETPLDVPLFDGTTSPGTPPKGFQF